jgi:hypothetical protein
MVALPVWRASVDVCARQAVAGRGRDDRGLNTPAKLEAVVKPVGAGGAVAEEGEDGVPRRGSFDPGAVEAKPTA